MSSLTALLGALNMAINQPSRAPTPRKRAPKKPRANRGSRTMDLLDGPVVPTTSGQTPTTIGGR